MRERMGSEKGEGREQVTKLEILPGRILNDTEVYPGQPAAYFIRTEGTKDTRQMIPGSLEDMLEELFGSEKTDFIVGINSPKQMLAAAEKFKAVLSKPEVQAHIKKLHAAREALRAELWGDNS